MSKPTPRPWQLRGDSEIYGTEFGSECPSGMKKIAEVKKTVYRTSKDEKIKEYFANAAHIVRCVNMHESLLSTLKLANETLQAFAANTPGMPKEARKTLTRLIEICSAITAAAEADE
jgi:hypothetical protein